MTDTTQLADTSDMIGVHNVLREQLGGARALVDGAAADPARVQLIASYYDNVLEFLHVHHAGEDELLWPKLIERLPEQKDLVERIAAQHHDVDGAVTRAHAAIDAWRATTDPQTTAEAGDALVALNDVLTAHLAEEEREILPLAAQVMTVPEWGELPGHAMMHFSADKPWLVVGLVRDQMTEAQKAAMLAGMPPEFQQFWVGTGQGLYDGFMAQVRG
jgi:hemerythrin-like domain-containing protein